MKKLIIPLIFLLAISSLALPDQSQDEKIAQLEKTIAEQEHTIRRAEKFVTQLKKQLAEQQEENRHLLALCRKVKIDTKQKLGTGDIIKIGKRIQLPLDVGQLVYFSHNQDFRIQQIIDKQNMIVEARIDFQNKFGESINAEYTRGGPYEPISRSIWISGLNTSAYADKTIISPDSSYLFKITGTRSYDTLFTGIETLFVLEPYISQK